MPSSQSALDSATVAPGVLALQPDYRALLITIDNLTPGPSDALSESLLKEAESAARALLSKTHVNDLPHIAAWRDAYKAFGAKPNRTRNSLEALTRRVEAGGLPRVNRLTDIYNAICVKHQIPLGGEDLDKYDGAPRLIRSEGKEPFEANSKGEKVVEFADVGEVVWCDDEGMFILDVLDPVTDEEVEAAGEDLVEVLRKTSPEIVVGRRMIGRVWAGIVNLHSATLKG
jgi:DNA/RNA-binding domain of Phe-tRNA-synthetase-like protein